MPVEYDDNIAQEKTFDFHKMRTHWAKCPKAQKARGKEYY